MDETYTAIPLSPLRKVIAARMAEANRTIPHFRLTTEIEVDALVRALKELREQYPQTHISLNDLLVKACATALMDVPTLNIQWVDGEIRQYHTADVSIVTALEAGGLSTPIIRRAEVKSVLEISREVKSLVARAERNALKLNEVFGGTFSISNLGMYGIEQFDAIINPPQCAILAIGCARPRMVVSALRKESIATVLRATLSVDHRALDGALGAAFLSALRQRIAQPHEWIRRGDNED